MEASRGAGALSVSIDATGCGLYSHSGKCNIYLNLYFFVLVWQNAALNFAI